jgi:hypothetical protein
MKEESWVRREGEKEREQGGRMCLRVWERRWRQGRGWGDSIAGVQGRIYVYIRSRISRKTVVLASNLFILVWGCEWVQEEQRAGNIRWAGERSCSAGEGRA